MSGEDQFLVCASILAITLTALLMLIFVNRKNVVSFKNETTPEDLQTLNEKISRNENRIDNLFKNVEELLNITVSVPPGTQMRELWKLSFDRDGEWGIHYSNVRLVSSTFFMGLSLTILHYGASDKHLIYFISACVFWIINLILFGWFSRWTIWAIRHQAIMRTCLKTNKLPPPEDDWELFPTTDDDEKTRKDNKLKENEFKRLYKKEPGIQAIFWLSIVFIAGAIGIFFITPWVGA